jgi:hypothetical protein
MTDTPPAFAEDVRKYAGDASRREPDGKELAKQKAEGAALLECAGLAGSFRSLAWTHIRSRPL